MTLADILVFSTGCDEIPTQVLIGSQPLNLALRTFSQLHQLVLQLCESLLLSRDLKSFQPICAWQSLVVLDLVKFE